MDVTARFGALLSLPEAEVALDEAMLLVAAQARAEVDVQSSLTALDDLAARCSAPTLDHLVRLLFVDCGFAGNRDDYYDPRNSYLDQVLVRHLGIPISLAVLAMVVGRRIGVPLAGVAMPGHFLLRDRVDPGLFVDPFGAGVMLDGAGCAALFRRLHGPGATFDERFLDPVGTHTILRRVLANLKAIHRSQGDAGSLLGVLRLSVLIPGSTDEDRRELAAALAATGQFAAAADELEAVAAAAGEDRSEADLTAATRFRARLN